MRRSFALVALLLLIGLPRVALAADLGVVATEGDAFAARLMRELEELGLSVAKARDVEGSTDTAVLVVGRELELYDRQPDGSRRKRRLAAKGDALKVAEEVHALMLPLVERPPDPARATPIAIAPPPPSERAIAPEPTSAARAPFEAHAGAGALLGGATPGLAVTLGLAYPEALRFGDLALGGGLVALVAAVPEKVSADAGTTDIRPVLFGPEIGARLGLARAFTTELALGGFAANVRFTARAVAPFATRNESAWAFAPNARLRVQYMFGAMGLFAEGRLGVAVSPIAVRFAGEEVHEWGSPWATAGAGLAVVF